MLHFHKDPPMSPPTGMLVTCLPAFQKVRPLMLMPDLLSKSCLSLEMFEESWLHCPPRISISKKTEITPQAFVFSGEWRGTVTWEE